MQIENYLERYLSARIRQWVLLPAFTGAATANTMLFHLEKGASRSREYAFIDDFHARSGFDENEMVLSLRGRTVPNAKADGGRLSMYQPIRRQLILNSEHLDAAYMPQYASALRQWKTLCIEAFSTVLYALVRWLADTGNRSSRHRLVA